MNFYRSILKSHAFRAGAFLMAAIGAVSTASADGCDFSERELQARIAQFESGLRAATRLSGEPVETWTLQERMEAYNVPGVSLAVICDGKVRWARAYGVKDVETGAPVDVETVFSVGSISKIGTAAILLRLAAENAVDLDADVNEYLTDWEVPTSRFTNTQSITLRHLMSHTSGLSVHGFPDFQPGETLPSVYDTLDGISPAKTEPVRSLFVPGLSSKYSGGGITVEQELIANVTGLEFEEAAHEKLFNVIGMVRSSYENPLPASHGNIAKAHDGDGALTALPRGWHAFPEKAASGLWTTPLDVATLLCAIMDSYEGGDDTFIPQPLAIDMMSEVGPSYFGLGPQLTGIGDQRRFFHSGSNESYRAWMEGHLETGDGMVIFTNGSNGAALYYEIRRALSDAMDWPFYPQIVEPPLPPDAGHRGQLIGSYRVVLPLPTVSHRIRTMNRIFEFSVEETDGELFVRFPGVSNNVFRLVRVAPYRYVLEGGYLGTPLLAHIEFVRGNSGLVSELILYRDTYSLSAMKVDSAAVERH